MWSESKHFVFFKLNIEIGGRGVNPLLPERQAVGFQWNTYFKYWFDHIIDNWTIGVIPIILIDPQISQIHDWNIEMPPLTVLRQIQATRWLQYLYYFIIYVLHHCRLVLCFCITISDLNNRNVYGLMYMQSIFVHSSVYHNNAIPANTKHLYNISTMLAWSGRRCINVVQMFCVCWDIFFTSWDFWPRSSNRPKSFIGRDH